VASTSIEMMSSTIRDLRPFVRRRDLLSDNSGGVGRLKFYRYGPSDLASLDLFWIFSNGCDEEDYHRNICHCYYVLDDGDSYSRLLNDILVLVLLPILIDYFDGCARACSLDIAA
jgi:hypothetical protein